MSFPANPFSIHVMQEWDDVPKPVRDFLQNLEADCEILDAVATRNYNFKHRGLTEEERTRALMKYAKTILLYHKKHGSILLE